VQSVEKLVDDVEKAIHILQYKALTSLFLVKRKIDLFIYLFYGL